MTAKNNLKSYAQKYAIYVEKGMELLSKLTKDIQEAIGVSIAVIFLGFILAFSFPLFLIGYFSKKR
jgi:hypothetical protein